MKAKNCCEISTLDLSYVLTVKYTVEILQNFVAFSEYTNFKKKELWFRKLITPLFTNALLEVIFAREKTRSIDCRGRSAILTQFIFPLRSQNSFLWNQNIRYYISQWTKFKAHSENNHFMALNMEKKYYVVGMS